MSKQTAVEFAFETLASQGLLVYKEYQNLVAYREAKEMEKEQHDKTSEVWFNEGVDYAYRNQRKWTSFEQYWQVTYGGNNE